MLLETPRLSPARRARVSWRKAAHLILLIFVSMLFLVPFYLMVRNALMTQAQIVAFDWVWFPWPPRFESFGVLLGRQDAPMLQAMRNSLAIALASVVAQVSIAAMAGYGLARVPSRWSNGVFVLVLVTLMIPGAVTFVPGFVLVSYLGWVSTFQGLIIPTMFNGFAAIWFRQHFLNFPSELEDAARVDGLNTWGLFWRIVIPNTRAMLIAQGTLVFINNWNAFLWPLVIGQDRDSWTVQIVLASFITNQSIRLPEIFAGTIISILPILLLFAFFQRYIIEGVTRSGINR